VLLVSVSVGPHCSDCQPQGTQPATLNSVRRQVSVSALSFDQCISSSSA